MRFTPYSYLAGRLDLDVSPVDMAAFSAMAQDQGRTSVLMTDAKTGNVYRVRRASCGLRCYCDATATLQAQP